MTSWLSHAFVHEITTSQQLFAMKIEGQRGFHGLFVSCSVPRGSNDSSDSVHASDATSHCMFPKTLQITDLSDVRSLNLPLLLGIVDFLEPRT